VSKKLTKEQIDAAFKKFDESNDGKLDYVEFCKMMNNRNKKKEMQREKEYEKKRKEKEKRKKSEPDRGDLVQRWKNADK